MVAGLIPAQGADVDLHVVLGFRAGREAASHNVYISSSNQAVIDGTAAVTTVTEASYGPLSLDLDKTYYWRVDEVNEAETPTTWQGDVWNFSTREYLVVDDFEDYNDFEPWPPAGEPDRIFDTWIDGWNVPANGSQVGYATPPFAERTVVHGGKQSVPFLYDNTTASYSEVSVNPGNLAVGSDWTVGSPKTLVLWFYGDPANAAERMYVKVNNAKVAYSGAQVSLIRPIWTQWNIELAPLGISLKNVTGLAIGFDRAGAVGGTGKVIFDDILLYREAPAIPSEMIWIEAEAANSISAPLQIMSDVAGASGGKYIQVARNTAIATANPPTKGIATYTLTVKGGTYVIRARIAIPTANHDAFWFRIQGATVDRTLHTSGWCQWNTVAAGTTWHWDDVHSSQSFPANQTVNWTMSAGTYTLQIAYMDVGDVPPMLDALMIVKVN